MLLAVIIRISYECTRGEKEKRRKGEKERRRDDEWIGERKRRSGLTLCFGNPATHQEVRVHVAVVRQ